MRLTMHTNGLPQRSATGADASPTSAPKRTPGGTLPLVGRLCCLGWFALSATGCSTTPEPAKPEPTRPGQRAEPEPTSPRVARSGSPRCVDPIGDAVARLGGVAASDLSLHDDIDLNGDGEADAIVRLQSGREPPHLLYVREKGCARFLDAVRAFRLGCDEERTQSGGYCVLWVETWLMHGDRQRSTMSFSDGAYRTDGDGVLIPGPRNRPR